MHFIAVVTLLLLTSGARAAELPDWTGIWARVEGNGGMFDVSTTKPPDGMAGSPGVRQYPPLTEAWEAKYLEALELAAAERVDAWRAGEVPFPSVRIDESTLIDLFAGERTGENIVERFDLDAEVPESLFTIEHHRR